MSKPARRPEKHRKVITQSAAYTTRTAWAITHNCTTIWLTGGKIGPSERNTISVDQLMAQVTAPQTRYSSIELSNQGQSISYGADGIGPPSGNPGIVFRDMFTEPQGGIAKQRRGLQRRASILDDRSRGIQFAGQPARQRRPRRLEQYLTSVREVEIRTQRADKWLDTPRLSRSRVQAQLNRDVSLERLGE